MENVYGNIDHIALELITRAYAAPFASDLDKLKKFNCVVQNIYVAMEFTDKRMIDAYKFFAILLKKLKESDVKYWAGYLKDLNVRATHAEFGKFAEWTQQNANIAQDFHILGTLKKSMRASKN